MGWPDARIVCLGSGEWIGAAWFVDVMAVTQSSTADPITLVPHRTQFVTADGLRICAKWEFALDANASSSHFASIFCNTGAVLSACSSSSLSHIWAVYLLSGLGQTFPGEANTSAEGSIATRVMEIQFTYNVRLVRELPVRSNDAVERITDFMLSMTHHEVLRCYIFSCHCSRIGIVLLAEEENGRLAMTERRKAKGFRTPLTDVGRAIILRGPCALRFFSCSSRVSSDVPASNESLFQ